MMCTEYTVTSDDYLVAAKQGTHVKITGYLSSSAAVMGSSATKTRRALFVNFPDLLQ